jgi:NAD kinase
MAQNPTLQDINSDKVVLQNYLTISSLPVDQKSGIFANISNEDKANLFRFHLAFQILKRPWLNQLQKDFLLETISTVSPQSYDQSPQIVALNQQNAQLLQQKILGLFQKQEEFDIFANLGGDSKDIEVLQKYNETNLPFYTINFPAAS